MVFCTYLYVVFVFEVLILVKIGRRFLCFLRENVITKRPFFKRVLDTFYLYFGGIEKFMYLVFSNDYFDGQAFQHLFSQSCQHLLCSSLAISSSKSIRYKSFVFSNEFFKSSASCSPRIPK